MEGINDLFIQNANGIPYVARCYGGNFCKIQPDHALVTGFFAAINSFRGEMGQKELNNVIYDKINLTFESQGDLLVVFNIDKEIGEEAFRGIAKEIQEKFIDTFGDLDEISPSEDFNEFIAWMDAKVGQGMADLRSMVQGRKRGLLGRIKDWLV